MVGGKKTHIITQDAEVEAKSDWFMERSLAGVESVTESLFLQISLHRRC